jgi:hypothetical protein
MGNNQGNEKGTAQDKREHANQVQKGDAKDSKNNERRPQAPDAKGNALDRRGGAGSEPGSK